jgi:pimeloyl-ACP methyl ester carboxylesterase
MKRRTLVLLSLLGAVLACGTWAYLYLIKYDIRREHLALHDASRGRDVPVELAVSRRAELKAKVFGIKPRVAIVNHGNTVRHSEYSFVGDVLATQGFLVASIQHDLPGDPPLSMQGFPFVGRLPSYQRAEANILFAIEQIKRIYPDPDFQTVTLFGHSQGGDIAMYFAGHHPDLVTKVVTLDNIRVPLLMSGKARVLSFRSSNFKADPGVVPSDEACEDAGIEVVNTDFQHDHFSDRGPDDVKEKVRGVLARFLQEDKPPKKPSLWRRQKDQSNDRVSVNYTPTK